MQPLFGVSPDRPEGKVKKRADVTCDDCYFRRSGLCALPSERPCPTFRAYRREGLAPPPQARLVPRPIVLVSAS
jgi:hypothetical protein